MERLQHGSRSGSIKLNVYKDPGSSFVLCHNTNSNREQIFKLQPDGMFESGIYNIRGANGDTAIGSRYFQRSGREEGRQHRLYRYNKSGDIEYHDKIWGKNDTGWRWLAKYIFHPETLDWIKLDV